MKLVVVTLGLVFATVCAAAPSADEKFNMGHVALLRNISESLDASIEHKKTQHAKILEVSKNQHKEILNSRTKLKEELKKDRAQQFQQIMELGDTQHQEMKLLLEQIMKNIESTDSFKLGQEHLTLIKKITDSLAISSNDNKKHNTELQSLYKQQHAELKNLKEADTKQIKEDRNRQFQLLKQKSTQQEQEIKKMLKELLSKMDQPRNCYELYQMGIRNNGVYLIRPKSLSDNHFVYCDMTDGGWTVIQRRDFYSEDKIGFINTWNNFRDGFGKLTEEFWLGNELIYQMTKDKPQVLKIDMKNFENVTSHATFSSFQLDSASTWYRIRISGGAIGQQDSMFVSVNGKVFDSNDSRRGCNDSRWPNWGGWWYNGCSTIGNLNGHHGNNKGYSSITYDGQTPLSNTVMKIKPSS